LATPRTTGLHSGGSRQGNGKLGRRPLPSCNSDSHVFAPGFLPGVLLPPVEGTAHICVLTRYRGHPSSCNTKNIFWPDADRIFRCVSNL